MEVIGFWSMTTFRLLSNQTKYQQVRNCFMCSISTVFEHLVPETKDTDVIFQSWISDKSAVPLLDTICIPFSWSECPPCSKQGNLWKRGAEPSPIQNLHSRHIQNANTN